MHLCTHKYFDSHLDVHLQCGCVLPWNSDSQLAERFLLLPTSARSQSGSLGRDVSRVDCTSVVLARPQVRIGASGLENCVARVTVQLFQESRSPVILHLCSTCTSEFRHREKVSVDSHSANGCIDACYYSPDPSSLLPNQSRPQQLSLRPSPSTTSSLSLPRTFSPSPLVFLLPLFLSSLSHLPFLVFFSLVRCLPCHLFLLAVVQLPNASPD